MVGIAGGAVASDLQVYPIRIEIDPASPTEVVTIKNRGDNDSLLQLSLMRWSQIGNEDKLEPTRDILANPGVFLVKGGDQQIARLGLRIPRSATEGSYRLVLQEVPRQRQEFGLSTVLRILIPVFVPAEKSVTAMSWDAHAARGGLEIVAHNSGTVHVQIRSVKLIRGGGAEPTQANFNIYVLPGAGRTFLLPLTRPVTAGSAVQLQVDSDQGPLSANVRVGSVEGASGHT